MAQNLKKETKAWMEAMTFNLLHDPEVTKNEDRYFVSFFVDDARSLIGERGKNLRTLQSLFRMSFYKKYNAQVQIDLDVNGYKKKREELLRNFALKARNEVLEKGDKIELEPMNPFDRRAVHAALSEHSDVRTESQGEGYDRRVVVYLA